LRWCGADRSSNCFGASLEFLVRRSIDGFGAANILIDRGRITHRFDERFAGVG
jgi:hypothetical protein